MRRLLIQILCITEVLLCAEASSPLSEDTLKSKSKNNTKITNYPTISVKRTLQCVSHVCRAV